MNISGSAMQILLNVVVILVLIFFLRRGWRRGLVRTIGRLLSFLAAVYGAWRLAKWLGPMLTEPISGRLEPFVLNRLSGMLANTASGESSGLGILSVIPGIGDLLEGLSESLLESVTSVVARELARILAWLIIFLIAFVILLILMHLLVRLLNWICKLPGLKFINRLGGAVVGALKGWLLLGLIVTLLFWLGVLPEENTFLLGVLGW